MLAPRARFSSANIWFFARMFFFDLDDSLTSCRVRDDMRDRDRWW